MAMTGLNGVALTGGGLGVTREAATEGRQAPPQQLGESDAAVHESSVSTTSDHLAHVASELS
jgi:hypothetical protein